MSSRIKKFISEHLKKNLIPEIEEKQIILDYIYNHPYILCNKFTVATFFKNYTIKYVNNMTFYTHRIYGVELLNDLIIYKLLYIFRDIFTIKDIVYLITKINCYNNNYVKLNILFIIAFYIPQYFFDIIYNENIYGKELIKHLNTIYPNTLLHVIIKSDYFTLLHLQNLINDKSLGFRISKYKYNNTIYITDLLTFAINTNVSNDKILYLTDLHVN